MPSHPSPLPVGWWPVRASLLWVGVAGIGYTPSNNLYLLLTTVVYTRMGGDSQGFGVVLAEYLTVVNILSVCGFSRVPAISR